MGEVMATEAQMAANKANAQKSTGPRTAAGKKRSAMNAVKDAMTARLYVGVTEAAKVEMLARMEIWGNHLVQDDDPVSLDLVAVGVRSYQRMQNCLDADDAAAAERIRHAEDRWDKEQQDVVSKLVDLMKTNAMSAVAALKSTVAGCDYLITSWKALLGSLDGEAWYDRCHVRARELLGYDNNDPKSTIILPDAWQDHLGRYMSAFRLKDKPIAFEEWHLRVMRVENIEKAIIHDQEVFQRLRVKALPCDEAYTAMMKNEISSLESQRARLVPVEMADRAESRIRALHDGSESGKLRHRYLNDAQRDLYRALKEVRTLQAERRKLGGPFLVTESGEVESEVEAVEAEKASVGAASRNEANFGEVNGYESIGRADSEGLVVKPVPVVEQKPPPRRR